MTTSETSDSRPKKASSMIVLGWDVFSYVSHWAGSRSPRPKRASTILRAPVGAIRCTQPEIAVNVDRPEDIALAQALLC